MQKQDKATEQMTNFAFDTKSEAIPAHVKKIALDLLIDTIGCALGGHGVTKGQLALQAAADFGRGDDVTIIGGAKSSLLAGTYANGELFNAIDMDAVVVPGHVTPFVISPVLSTAEFAKRSGADLIRGVVLAHEVACRVAGAYTALRTKVGDNHELSPVTGYGSTIVGGAMGAGLMLGLDRPQLLNCFGTAAYMAPVPSLGKYLRLPYSPTAKYTSSGWVSTGSVLAARLSASGYVGDREVLDGDYGFWRMFASDICDWDFMLDDLGVAWRMDQSEIKPYPSFRMGHPGVEALIKLLADEKISPEEIEQVEVRVDPVSASPIYLNTDIKTHSDAFVSWPFVVAVSTMYPPGPAWQSKEALADPRVRELVSKVKVIPDWSHTGGRKSLNDPVSHPVQVTVVARGERHLAKLMPFPKGHPKRPLTSDEFDAKFLHNASFRISESKAEELLALLKDIPKLDKLEPVFACLAA